MYWETGIFGDDFVKSVMPRNRFDSISFSLHWLDAADVTADERKAKNKADGYWAIDGFVETLALNSQICII